ncbi:hypothetical protein [Streptomyces oceani]|uniref:Uncharacterized protein n=1 Tax=Streptomyces oceani TaxID=1075402 RepID=A0A1E7KKB1_9ACTN|nr:hypothetical protein [Streptomyces oceani]OEV04375.1 hypothetical protein AN216_08630 [Streptomyces oceani]
MPKPGSKSYDIQRARRRKAAKNDLGESGQEANEEAKQELEQDPQWRPAGPESDRARGPKGERPEPSD